MATLIELDGKVPTVGERVYLAPTAVLIGDVRVADGANIWFGAVLRGDFSHIAIGEGSSVQDNCVLHCAEDLPTVVGANVIVGHGAILEGCDVGDGALIGMGSVVCQRARVGAGTMLAVVVGAAVLAAGAAGVVAWSRASDGACTNAGCQSSVAISVPAAEWTRVERVTVCVNATCVSGHGPRAARIEVRPKPGPGSRSVVVVASGRRGSPTVRAVTVELTKSTPNGEGCGPICWFGPPLVFDRGQLKRAQLPFDGDGFDVFTKRER